MDLAAYLAQATPEEWHQVAWNWNWDAGIEPLRWIIRQPTCDRGTALLVYWYAGPRYKARYASRDEVPLYQLEGFDLVMEIEAGFLAGRYSNAQISFDPRDDLGHDWTAEYGDQPYRRLIPPQMYMASPGRKVARDGNFDEGYPPGVDRDG